MRKPLTMLIVSIALLAVLSPVCISENTQKTSKEVKLFDRLLEPPLKGELTTKSEGINLPLTPGETKQISVKVGYRVEGRLIGRLISQFLLKDSKAKIEINIAEIPDFCDEDETKLSKNKIEIPISMEEKIATINLTIKIKEEATAFQKDSINLDINSNVVKDPYINFFTLVNQTQTSEKIPITTGYTPKIDLQLTKNKEIPPEQESIIPINITNQGNGKTTVSLKVMRHSQNFHNVSLSEDQIDVEQGKMETVYLNIIPVKDFANETIEIRFTPSYGGDENVKGMDDEYLTGDSITKQIVLLNDGSLKEEKQGFLEENLTWILIAVFIIAIITLAAITIWYKKQKEKTREK
ncbi:MAG: hypothetical protein V5A64_05245 [Candidatus Thermoplasmatota archaeon]